VLFSAAAGSRSAHTTAGKEDSRVALTEIREGGFEGVTEVTWAELRRRAGRLEQAMKAGGVRKGDCVAVVASNSADTLIVMLAVTALGGVFSSSSTDMGADGILARLRQIKPRYLIMDDMAVYNGKTLDLRDKMQDIVRGMDGIREFQGIVSVPRFSEPRDVSGVRKTQTLAAFLAQAKSDALEFERVEFADPFLVAYSSGTTGQPKCIVHSVGGALLNIHKEGNLHLGMTRDAVVLQYTTTGWIMYLVAVESLVFGARAILYDGSPFIPDPTILIRLAAEQR
jgi:acetoacetyl-CoA synthetase